jgi:hypothetical protein
MQRKFAFPRPPGWHEDCMHGDGMHAHAQPGRGATHQNRSFYLSSGASGPFNRPLVPADSSPARPLSPPERLSGRAFGAYGTCGYLHACHVYRAHDTMHIHVRMGWYACTSSGAVFNGPIHGMCSSLSSSTCHGACTRANTHVHARKQVLLLQYMVPISTISVW